MSTNSWAADSHWLFGHFTSDVCVFFFIISWSFLTPGTSVLPIYNVTVILLSCPHNPSMHPCVHPSIKNVNIHFKVSASGDLLLNNWHCEVVWGNGSFLHNHCGHCLLLPVKIPYVSHFHEFFFSFYFIFFLIFLFLYQELRVDPDGTLMFKSRVGDLILVTRELFCLFSGRGPLIIDAHLYHIIVESFWVK